MGCDDSSQKESGQLHRTNHLISAERGGHRRGTVGGVWRWHVCDLAKLDLPRKNRAVDRSVDRLVLHFCLILLEGSRKPICWIQ